MPDVAGIRPTENYASFLDRMYIDGLELPSIHEYEIDDPNAWENIRKDPKFRHAIDYSLDLATGDGFNLRPGGNRPEDHLAKDVVQAVLDNVTHFHKSIWAMSTHRFFGVAYSYVKGKPGIIKLPDGRIVALEYKPYKFQDVNKDRVKVYWEKDHEVRDVWSLSQKKWLRFDERALMILTNSCLERNVGQGDPLLQPIAWAHYCKKRVEKAALQLIDRFSGGFMVIKVDKNSGGSPTRSIDALQSEYIAVVPKARANKFMVMRKEDELTILEPNGQGVQIVQWLLEYYDQAVQIIAIGSNLPVQANTGGSYSLAVVQENSNFHNILKTRKEDESAINDQFIPLVFQENRRPFQKLGIAEAARPIFEIRDPRNQKPEEAVQSIEIASNIGLPLDDADTREKLNVKDADPEAGKVVNPIPQKQQNNNPEVQEDIELEENVV